MHTAIPVFEEINRVARCFSIPKLASLMNVSKGALWNKFSNSENTRHHKVTLGDFIDVMRLSGDVRPLEVLASHFDCVIYRLPDLSNCSDEALLDLVNKVHAEGGDVHREMSNALADGIVTPEEYAAVHREVDEWLAAILELRARFKGLVVYARQ